MRFAVTIKVWRKMHQLSASEMAILGTIATSTYSFIENGDRSPTMAEFSRLCQAMDMNASDFFTDKGKVKNG